MSTETEFTELYTAIFEAGTTPYRFCVKRGGPVEFATLLDLECWSCSEFVLNKGMCDPL